jgi:hypothetical protein
MRIQRVSNKNLGYAYHDAIWAIKLLKQTGDQHILARKCGMTDGAFSDFINGVVNITRLNGYSENQLGLTAASKNVAQMKPHDLKTIAEFLGKKYDEPDGFPSIAAMILYAQKTRTLPEGKYWVIDDYAQLAAEAAKKESGEEEKTHPRIKKKPKDRGIDWSPI